MKKIIGLFMTFVFVIVGLTACGSNDDKNVGKVATDGSTSMEKVIGTLGETYMKENDGIKFTFNPTGSSAGIKAVLEGRCDIGLASRYLKDEEKSQGLKETGLAYDGIAIVINKDNPVKNLTLEQISKIYKGEIKNWKEVGGEDLEIVLIGREAGSGTRDGFESITKTVNKNKYRQELTSTGDVITTVSKNNNAIGYASLSSVKSDVKTVSVNGVKPSEETIKDSTYVVQRPFMLITKTDKALTKEAKEFFDYITSEKAIDAIKSAGVVPAYGK